MGAVMRTILDTSVLIGEPLSGLGGELAVSVASLAELQFGVLVSDDPVARAIRLQRLSRVQLRFKALPMDEAVAGSYAMLAAATVRAGRQPRRRAFDLVIAATAHAHGARLATMNVVDVEHLANVIDIVRPEPEGDGRA